MQYCRYIYRLHLYMEENKITTNMVTISADLFSDLCGIIDKARLHVATYANVEVCMMNWSVGRRIKEDVLFNQRAQYGKQIYKDLSAILTKRYGIGWGEEKLKHCVRSAYTIDLDSPS